jgi:hypothetical protein
MTGARVLGRLNLSGAHIATALRFERCVFDDEVDLRQARAAKSVEWIGGSTAAILADEFESEATLTLQDVRVAGILSLRNSTADMPDSAIHGATRSTPITSCWTGNSFHRPKPV